MAVANSFGREFRLTTAAEYSRVFKLAARKRGKRLTAPNLSVYVCDNGLARARLGLAIAKKIVRRAVDRNRIKRIVREDFRKRSRQLGGLDIVVMARVGLAGKSAGSIRAQLEEHWYQLRRPLQR